MQGCDRFGFQWSLLPSVTATEMKLTCMLDFCNRMAHIGSLQGVCMSLQAAKLCIWGSLPDSVVARRL
jgi:hypothetical protein